MPASIEFKQPPFRSFPLEVTVEEADSCLEEHSLSAYGHVGVNRM